MPSPELIHPKVVKQHEAYLEELVNNVNFKYEVLDDVGFSAIIF
jgi:hypothetical protein